MLENSHFMKSKNFSLSLQKIIPLWYEYVQTTKIMKKLPLTLLCLPMIGFEQQTYVFVEQ